MELWAKVMSLERVAGPKNTDSASRDVVEKHDEGIVLGKDKRERGQMTLQNLYVDHVYIHKNN